MGLYTLWSEKVHAIGIRVNAFFSEVILICRWKTLSDTQNWTFKSLVSSSRCDWEPDRLLGLECEVLTPPSPLSCGLRHPVHLLYGAPPIARSVLEVSFSSVSQPCLARDCPIPGLKANSNAWTWRQALRGPSSTLIFYFLSLDRKEG